MKSKNGSGSIIKCKICDKKFYLAPWRIKRKERHCSNKCRGIAMDVKGDKNPLWKGDAVGYGALHDWVSSHKGKPKFCEHCYTENDKKFVWANKSHEYKRDLSDWIRLCTSCHIKFDNSANKAWITRGGKKGIIKSCLLCGKKKYINQYQTEEKGRGNYCSNLCKYKELSRRMMGNTYAT